MVCEQYDVVMANTYREGHLDCTHYGSLVVVNDMGEIIYRLGNPSKMVFERSTTKIYKTANIVQQGVADKFNFNLRELALMAGSHSGESIHLSILQNILSKIGASTTELLCGKDTPLGDSAMIELLASGERKLSAAHCNCSGEHSGYIAMCKHFEWKTENYLEESHPAHLLMRDYINMHTEYVPSTSVADGCGLQNCYMPLRSIATGMANFCSSEKSNASNQRVIEAIFAEPNYFAGKGRFVTDLIISSKQKIIGKDGAEGLFFIGFPGLGIGIAIKIADGNHRAAIPVLCDVIDALGIVSRDEVALIRMKTAQPTYTNNRSLVGETHSVNVIADITL